MTNNSLGKLEDAINFIADKSNFVGAKSSLEVLSEFLGALLQVDYVLINKYYKEKPNVTESITIYTPNGFADNVVYDLKDTPCHNVIGTSLCSYESNIQQLFPKDEFLLKMNVDSYVGMPLWGSNEEPIGLIAVMDQKKLTDLKTIEFVLKAISSFAGRELERIIYEGRLKVSEDRFNLLLQSSEDMISIHAPSGRYLYYNGPSCYAITPEDLLGKMPTDIYNKEDSITINQAFEKVEKTGKSQKIEALLDWLGERKWFSEHIYPVKNSDGEVIEMLKVSRDIHDRKITEQEIEEQNKVLIESKKQLQTLNEELHISNKELNTAKEKAKEDENYLHKIINHIGDPIFVKDDQSRLLIVNDAFCKAFGLIRANIMGKTLAEDVAPDERESFLKIDKQVLSHGVENVNEESLTVRGGQPRTISTRKTRLINSDGKTFLIGVIRDITERRITEQEVEEQNKILVKSEKELLEINGEYLILNEELIQTNKELQATKDKIEESEVKFRAIFDNSKDAIVVTKNGIGIFFNPAYLQLFGYEKAEELSRKAITEQIAVRERERISKFIKERNKGGSIPINYESIGLRKNGEEFDYEISVSTYVLAHEKYTLGIIRDITQRKLIQKELDLQNKKLNDLNSTLNEGQKLSHIGNWQWDISTDKAEWSDEMYNIYGVTKDDFYPSNENVAKTVLREDLHKVEHGIGSLLNDQIFTPFEFRIMRPSGEIRNLYIIALEKGNIEDAKENLIFGVTQDITQQKQIQEENLKAKISLENTEKELNEAQKLAHIGSWLFDLKTQKIAWSDETFHIWGFDSNEGAPEFDAMIKLIHTDDQALLITAIDKATKLGTPYDIEHRICLSNYQEKVVRAICQPILGVNGEVVSLAGTSQDITEKKIAENKITKSLEEKELLLRELYHRTKNNMQVISSMLSIKSLYTNNEEVKAILEETKSRIMGMALVHQKLYQANDLSQIDLKDYITDLVELLKSSLLPKISNLEIVTNLANTQTNIDTAIPCGLIINELFTNAIKYAFPNNKKGLIKITLMTNDENEICITVTDNGVGFPAALDFRNSNSYGLDAVVMLSEVQLGGSITLDSKNGTEFILKFKESLNSERV